MKTVMKRLFSLMLVAVLLVGVMPMAAHADVLSHTHEDTDNDNVCDIDSCTFVMDSCKAGHTPAGSYMYDGKQHWQVCSTCKGWVGYTAHSGGEATCKDQAVCSVCGQAYGAINATNHKNTTVKDASAATCKDSGHEGNTWCLDCNALIATGNVIPATGNHVAADSTYGKDNNQHWQVCSCGEYFGYTAHSWNAATCTAAKTCSVCGQIEGTAAGHKFPTTCGSDQICSVCKTPNPNPLNHEWDSADCETPATCKKCGFSSGSALEHIFKLDSKEDATCESNGYEIYKCRVCGETKRENISKLGHNIGSEGKCLREGCSYTENTRYAVEFYKDYNEHNDPVTKFVAKGTKVYSIYTPYRDGYSFEGWYTVSGSRVSESATVTGDSAYFAKWTQNAPHEVYVKFYTHGNTKNVVKYVDMHHYAHDGVISLDDLMTVAKKNFKARGNESLYIQGPFTSSEWDIFCDNSAYRNTSEKIEVSQTSTTVIHAMVRNVDDSKTSSSSSKADSSNPKTGDMIFAPVAVMGLSVSALAVLFYLNKKRAY